MNGASIWYVCERTKGSPGAVVHINMRQVVALLSLLAVTAAACAPVSVDSPDAPQPEAITFGSTDARLSVAVASAVARWNAATCLDLAVSDAPAHRVVFAVGLPRMAQTNGMPDSATIRVFDDTPEPWHYTPELLEQLVLHETAHLLALTNDHVSDGALGPGSGNGVLSETTLSAVCAQRDCGCFNPE